MSRAASELDRPDDGPAIVSRVQDGVRWLTLNRPQVKNAMTRGFYRELVQALDESDADDAVRCVVIHGSGDAFCAGGDTREFGTLSGLGERQAYMAVVNAAYHAIERCRKPVIAAVHGFCIGGGCELTMCCDIVIADETARFGLPEARLGLIPGPGSAVGLTQLNLHWLKLMVLGCEILDAQDARLAGLVTRIVPAGEHVSAAQELARRISGLAPLSLSVGKRLLNDLAPRHWEQSTLAVTMLQGTDDFKEGIASFTERRPPSFQGT
jgi:enoyl-CoA hydratase/carnithine racemase